MAAFDEKNQAQIIRKDGKDCFVESLSDTFNFGMAHFVFVGYDLHKPAGERQTNRVSAYITMAELLEVRRELISGEMRETLKVKRAKKDSSPIHEWMGGVSAAKLAERGQAREDGMCLSRVMKLLSGTKYDFMFVADSGPGVQNENGLITPKFGNKAENHVLVSMKWSDFSELVLLTCAHYEAFLTAQYLKKCEK